MKDCKFSEVQLDVSMQGNTEENTTRYSEEPEDELNSNSNQSIDQALQSNEDQGLRTTGLTSTCLQTKVKDHLASLGGDM